MRPIIAMLLVCFLSMPILAQHTIELEEDRYEEALEKAVKERKPMFVYIGAEWCGPCKQMKRELIEPMKAAGEFDQVVFVELEYEKDDCETLVDSSKMIPQFFAFNPRSKKLEKFRGARAGYYPANDESRLQIRAVIRKALGK